MSNQTNIINRLSLLLRERKNSPNSSSYTSQLFIEGTEKIIAKIKEESEELIESAEADVLDKAVEQVLHNGVRTADLLQKKDAKPASTKEVCDAILGQLDRF